MMIWVGDRDFGSLVSQDEALISVLDHGFTVADGIFETLKVVNGSAFAISRHLRRLSASARAMGLVDPDLDVIRAAVGEVLFANRPLLAGPGRLRITYTGASRPWAVIAGPRCQRSWWPWRHKPRGPIPPRW